jgi:hypothetical protein
VDEAVKSFTQARYVLGATGMASGAASGFLIHPWIGPLVGAAFGALLGLARREGALRERVLGAFKTALAHRQNDYFAELRAEEARVAAAIRAALEQSLERVMVRFGRFINEPIEAERQAIEAEQRKLGELEALRAELGSHDRELERLLEAAANASVGLCR